MLTQEELDKIRKTILESGLTSDYIIGSMVAQMDMYGILGNYMRKFPLIVEMIKKLQKETAERN